MDFGIHHLMTSCMMSAITTHSSLSGEHKCPLDVHAAAYNPTHPCLMPGARWLPLVNGLKHCMLHVVRRHHPEMSPQ